MTRAVVIQPPAGDAGTVRVVELEPGVDIPVSAGEVVMGILEDPPRPSAATPELVSREVTALEAIAGYLTGPFRAIVGSTNRLLEDGLHVVHTELRRMAIAAEKRNDLLVTSTALSQAASAEHLNLGRQLLAVDEAESVRDGKTRVAQREPAGDLPGQGVGTDSASLDRVIRPERVNDAVELIRRYRVAGLPVRIPEAWFKPDPIPRRALLSREPGLYILFDGPPGHESGRFIEVEDETGASVSAGEWRTEAGAHPDYPATWVLGPFQRTV